MQLDSPRNPSPQSMPIDGIGRLLDLALDPACGPHAPLQSLCGQLGIEHALLLIDGGNGMLRAQAWIGIADEDAARARYARESGVIGKVFASGEAALCSTAADAFALLDRSGSFDLAESARDTMAFVVPVRANRRVLGVLAALRAVQAGDDPDGLLRTLEIGATLLACRLPAQQADKRRRPAAHARRDRVIREPIVGPSKRMQRVREQLRLASLTYANVLIRGEAGSGKETIAREIHDLSARRGGPFVRIHGTALTETALDHPETWLEAAAGGTLFIDEIGDVPPRLQARLLDMLDHNGCAGVICSNEPEPNARLVCASALNLERMVARGEFRADLYYRIHVVSIHLPPLRERSEDVGPLAEFFLRKYNASTGRALQFASDALETLGRCSWPGNVRELGNCIEHAATLSGDDTLTSQAFACDRCLARVLRAGVVPTAENVIALDPAADVNAEAQGQADEMFGHDKRARIVSALEKCGWVQAKAARMLNMTPRQIGYAIKRMEIAVQQL